MKTSPSVLALFFTYPTTLEEWVKTGMVDRERRYLHGLLQGFDHIYLITYGLHDKQYESILGDPSRLIILPRRLPYIPAWMYSWLIPLVYRRELRRSAWLKTNQVLGGWSAVVAAWLFRKRLLVRTGYLPSRFARFARKPWHIRIFLTTIETFAFRAADRIMVASQGDQQYVCGHYYIAPNKISVIPNSIDTDRFQPRTKDLEKETLSLLCIARLVPQKNLVNLLQALVTISDIHLRIIGDGPLRGKLVAFAQHYQLPVEFLQPVPNNDLPRLYQRADIYIQPSLYEGSPKTILEAMSCGLPVIATRVSGITEVITHEETGYLCSTNVESIRQALIHLKQQSGLRSQLGQAARQYILKHHSLDQLLARELALYSALGKRYAS